MTIKTLSLLTLTAAIGCVQAENLKPANWVLLPAIGSSPETGFQYGAYVMRQFEQTSPGEPQDRMEVLLQGTAKGQFQAYIWPDFYVAGGDWNLYGTLGGKYWPTPYYEQGNDSSFDDDKETFDLTTFESEIGAAYRVTPTLRIGSIAFADNESISDDPDDPLLSSDQRGYEGGFYSGIGLVARWDTRNDRDWPTSGSLASFTGRQYTEYLGSDSDFGTIETSIGHYIAVGDDVIALGASYDYGCETTPFSRLPRPEGSRTLRGANGNIWSDHHLLGLQSEYRMTLSQRWAVTGFLDTAQVASELSELGADRFHTSIGGGIRYSTIAESRFNIRADIGLVDMESVGFVISVGESF
jgi:hypothetical protein